MLKLKHQIVEILSLNELDAYQKLNYISDLQKSFNKCNQTTNTMTRLIVAQGAVALKDDAV